MAVDGNGVTVGARTRYNLCGNVFVLMVQVARVELVAPCKMM